MENDSPYLWLATLESARRSGDESLADKCLAKLKTLGVRIKFVPKSSKSPKKHKPRELVGVGHD